MESINEREETEDSREILFLPFGRQEVGLGAK